MTACTTSFSYIVDPQTVRLTTDNAGSRGPSNALLRSLLERFAARISSGTDEIAPFTTVERAAAAVASTYASGRRIGLATTETSLLASCVAAAASSTRFVGINEGVTPRALIELARDVDVLLLEAPQIFGSEVREPLTPRQLLELRARASRTLIVLDLLNEDLARMPLTQAALLIPGTLVLRGFGLLWAAEGATSVAETAFVAGSSGLVSALQRDAFTPESLERMMSELDASDIDRRVQAAARTRRANLAHI